MFICSTKKGKTFTEGQEFIDIKKGEKHPLTWDDLPKDIEIAALQLLYPFPIKFRNPDGTSTKKVTPKLTIQGFSRYFFFNEATVPLQVKGEKVIRQGVAVLEAKTIAGIDDKAKVVIQIRMDKWGNSSLSKYPLETLERLLKKGTFRGEIIRNGS